ncbi:MAG: NADH-quinone oxidoreductase subunit C [Bdellovibrionota bacterium]
MNIQNQVEVIQSKLGSRVSKIEFDRVGCPIVWASPSNAIEVLRFLRDGEGLEYQFMADLTAYDDQDSDEESQGRFVVVYNLYSPENKTRIRVKVRVAEDAEVPTACSVWEAANWAEREVYDLFGIKFSGHPDLRRILLDIRWQGHPLRKDYPLRRYQLFNDPEQIPKQLLEGEPHGKN